jgi:hypothetical protein
MKEHIETAKTEVVKAATAVNAELSTTATVSFTYGKIVRYAALIVGLILAYSTITHWYSYLNVDTSSFSIINLSSGPVVMPSRSSGGALGAVSRRMLELLMLKSGLTIALFMVAFPERTIHKIQAFFGK